MRLLSPMPILAMSTVLALAVLPQVCPAHEKREEEPRMKGVELYSWKDKEGEWMFVLLDGTNRVKTEKEVKQAKTKVKDIDALKRAIATLAVGEQVFWMHPIAGFNFPPEATRKDVAKAAKDARVDLHVLQ